MIYGFPVRASGHNWERAIFDSFPHATAIGIVNLIIHLQIRRRFLLVRCILSLSVVMSEEKASNRRT